VTQRHLLLKRTSDLPCRPRPVTTIQCQRAHGSRSSRAGILVVMARVSTSVTAGPDAQPAGRRTSPSPSWNVPSGPGRPGRCRRGNRSAQLRSSASGRGRHDRSSRAKPGWFGALPRDWRRPRWAGPVYELVVWLGLELGIAPVLGLSQAKRARPVDRLAHAGDQLLYGVVLTATRPNAGS
jgi:hypothetical protein